MPRDKTIKRRPIRLSDRVWSALEAVAEREGLLYGGLPSRPAAVGWLLERDAERQSERPNHKEQG